MWVSNDRAIDLVIEAVEYRFDGRPSVSTPSWTTDKSLRLLYIDQQCSEVDQPAAVWRKENLRPADAEFVSRS